MHISFSIFIGLLVALMIQLNGSLQTAVGGISALLVIHICGLFSSMIFFLFFRKKFPGDKSRNSPKYCLITGMLGALIVYLANLIYLKGGILLSLSGTLAGQAFAASIAEGFYPEGRERSPLFQRIISPALLFPGSIIIGLKAEVSLVWVVVSWIPGIILMVQQTMNSRNAARYGAPAAVVINYVSALILLIPLYFFIMGISDAPVKQLFSTLSELPLAVITGGGLIGVLSTGGIALLLLKAPALFVILGMFSGELAGGIFLDLYSGNPVAVEKIIGIVLIVIGLSAGKIRFRREDSRV